MAEQRICWGEAMRSLFLKLYSVSLLSILISMVGTFSLLWYQWQPENNYKLSRFSEPAIHYLADALKKSTQKSLQEPKLVVGEVRLPMNQSEVEALRRLSAQMHGLVSLIFKSDLNLSSDEEKRLKQQLLVYKNTVETKFAYLNYDQNRVLELELTRLKGSATKWMASAIYLAHHSPGSLEEKLQRLQKSLSESEGKPVIQALTQAGLSRPQLTRLVIMPQAYSGVTSSNYSVKILHQPFASSDKAKVVSFDVHLSPTLLLPPAIFLPLISLILALAFWFSLRPYVNKTTKLSKITQQFSEGDLKARVNLKGHGPIEKLAQQFDHAADHVVGLLRAQETLLKAVAHELRTPISKLFFYGELLSSAHDETQKQQLLEDYHSSVQDLTNLTNELLTDHRYRSGTLALNLSKINLSHIVLSECRESVYLSHAIQLELNDEQTFYIWGEEQPVRRVLTNLITNANQYAQSHIKVSLSLSSKEPSSYVELWVEDDGEGVPQNQRKAIFDTFYRVDESRNRQSGGLGLGLSITWQIVKALGGEITVDESETLGGARFIVRLPLLS